MMIVHKCRCVYIIYDQGEILSADLDCIIICCTHNGYIYIYNFAINGRYFCDKWKSKPASSTLSLHNLTLIGAGMGCQGSVYPLKDGWMGQNKRKNS